MGPLHGVKVIEDASHAVGAEYRGERIGNCRHSDMVVFSFHPVKLMTTAINDTYGLGVFSMPCKTGAVIGHSGSLAGQVCVTAHDARHGLTVAVTRTSNDLDEEHRKKDQITDPERILCTVLKTLLERSARTGKGPTKKQGGR